MLVDVREVTPTRIADGHVHHSEDGRLGAVVMQEMLLRNQAFDPALLRRVAEYLGVTIEE